MRRFSRRILAGARSRARLSGKIRRRFDQGRLSRRADPGRIRRQRADDDRRSRDHGRNPGFRLQRRRLPRADVHDGHGAPARQRRAEKALSAGDRARRPSPAGVRRHRADLRHRHIGPAHHGGARRQRQLRRQRPEDLDVARRAFRSHAAARPHHAARAGEEAHRRAFGLSRRHARGQRQRPDHPSDPHHDEPRHDRSVLREHARAGGKSHRRRGRRLPLHPLRHECRAHSDRRRMHRRRQMVHPESHGLCRRARRVRPADRPKPGRPVSHRALPTSTCAPPN